MVHNRYKLKKGELSDLISAYGYEKRDLLNIVDTKTFDKINDGELVTEKPLDRIAKFLGLSLPTRYFFIVLYSQNLFKYFLSKPLIIAEKEYGWPLPLLIPMIANFFIFIIHI